MPGDAQHNKIGIAVCCLMMLPLILYGIDYVLIGIFAVIYMFATRYLSPDLDINSKPYQRWGVLRVLWWPYMKIYKHRQSSHSLIIGPITAILYLLLFVLPAIYVFMYISLSVIPMIYAMLYVWVQVAAQMLDCIKDIEPNRENGMLVLVGIIAIVAARWTHTITDMVLKGER